MAIVIQFSFYIRNLSPKFQINLTKNNFAKGPKQKPEAKSLESLDLRSLGDMESLSLSPFCLKMFLKIGKYPNINTY